MKTSPRAVLAACAALLLLPCIASLPCLAEAPSAGKPAARVELKRDDAKGRLQVLIDGKEALVYQYGPEVDMAHYYPVRSPSGRLLTVQETEPYPHHRSVWFADTVQLEGQRKTSFYMARDTRVDKKDPKSPCRDRIRHVKFLAEEAKGAGATLAAQLVWEADMGKLPVLDEVRRMRVVALGGGEYFLDGRFTVTAAYGDVTFLSDQAHYAWPYVRMHPQFSVEKGGGTIAGSEGGVNEAGTLMKLARWLDYSAKVEGVTEGLAMFAADPKTPARWFTRNYGTWGPRRPDAQSGKPFVLKKGESLEQRVGILVHSGDVKEGKVAERYQQYVDGRL
jgi:hypothetical protein